MSVVLDILRTYRAPREVLRRRIGASVREDRALVTLMAACATGFVAQWPRLSREAFIDPSIGLDARIAGALFGWIMVMPLAFYLFGLIVQGALRLAGRRPGGYPVRMAVFWPFLAVMPLLLFTGLLAGFAGPGPLLSAVSIVPLVAFGVFFAAGLSVVSGASGEEAS